METPIVSKGLKYAKSVVSGKVDACSLVISACKRHIDDLQRAKSAEFPYKFDRIKAEKAAGFASLMVHTKGKWAGKPILLEPWQAFIITVVFGWVRKSDGLRRFREAYCEIPRKNGKSVLGAVVGNYMFVADGEPGSEVYSGASTEKQAWEVFRPARLMTERAPGYKEHFGIQVQAKNIYHPASASRFEPLIGNPGDGASPHCAIIDEYHEHQTPNLYDTMLTGMGARSQPLQFVITTAGVNLAGPCYDKRGQICRILDGAIVNDEVFGIIYTLDEDDDWSDIKNWKKANPNYGISVFPDFLEARLLEATQRASRQNIIRCKHLNQWMNADSAFFNIIEWNKCGDKGMSLEDFTGQPCWFGLDLASKVDIASLVILFRRDNHYYAFCRHYLPTETINLPENTHYQGWQYENWLIATPGAVIDYDVIETDIREMASTVEIQEVAYDPFQATQLSTRMTAEGFPMVEMRPTVLNFSEPMKELESLVMSGRLHHAADPVLSWMASNVVAHMDVKDNVYPRKERNSAKIDGVVALIMALGRAMAGGGEKKSVYEDRGVLVL